LGLEWVKQLASRGYTVYLSARDLKSAQEAALMTGYMDAIIPVALDVCDENQLQSLAKQVQQSFGFINLIINNAGVNPKDYADKTRMAKAFYLDQLDAREVLDVIHTNSIAPLLVVKHFRHLLKSASKPIVVNISSWLGSVSQLSFGGHYAYTGSKNLLNIFNKSMAFELKADGIICVNVNPGWVQTAMGGAKANFTTEQAVQQLFANVIDSITLNDSGRFIHYDGTDHAW
jgi:NAD(P)-dependent dehydrogenase (short-subunit alcohol dehydrogenase family)